MQVNIPSCSAAPDGALSHHPDLKNLSFFAEGLFLQQNIDSLSEVDLNVLQTRLQHLQACLSSLVEITADGLSYRYEHGLSDSLSAAQAVELLASISRYITDVQSEL